MTETYYERRRREREQGIVYETHKQRIKKLKENGNNNTKPSR